MRALGLALVLVVLAGCDREAARAALPPLEIDMAGGASAESFAALLGRAAALGYHVEFADPAAGVFGARAQTAVPRGVAPATLVVQCFADGHATVSIVGGVIAGRSRTPAPLRREAVALAQALDEGSYLP